MDFFLVAVELKKHFFASFLWRHMKHEARKFFPLFSYAKKPRLQRLVLWFCKDGKNQISFRLISCWLHESFFFRYISLWIYMNVSKWNEMKWISKPNRYTATCLCVNQFKIKFFRMPFTKPKKWNKKENKMLLRKWLRVVRITDEETKGNRTPKQTRKYGKNIPNIVPNTRSTEWKKNNKKIHKTNTKQQRQKTRKRCIQHEEVEEKKAHMWTKKKEIMIFVG